MNVTKLAMAVALTVSGVSHAYLYIHGYQHIPTIGTAFVVQASVSFALALLILIGGPSWLLWAAAALAGGAVGIVAHRRPIRLLRARMAALTTRGDQRVRRTGGRRDMGDLRDRPSTQGRPADLAAIAGDADGLAHYFQKAFMGGAYMSLSVSGARVPGVRKASSIVAIRLYSLA
jgi:hypothetical protein